MNDENAKQTVLSGLDRLIISIDGTTQATYEAYRIGGKLEKVLHGAQTIVKWTRQLNSSNSASHISIFSCKTKRTSNRRGKKIAREIGIHEAKFKLPRYMILKMEMSLYPKIKPIRGIGKTNQANTK